MSDQSLNKYIQYGTAAERAAFTPDPPAGVQVLYTWYETDTGDVYVYDSTWHLLGGASIPVLSADPSAPPDDTAWIRATGTTPTRTIALRVRDGGVTETLAQITK